MSAIFGILDLEGRAIDFDWIKSMQRDLSHRGPDRQGIYQEHSLILGHMLLQVTPESVYDKSPFEENDFVITANARLDERDTLLDRLNIDQAERQETTDAMLLLRCYRKWGKDFVKDIYGDFSFAIWDKKKKELFCARDHMGVKPFLYYFQDMRFVFSTELKAIVKLPCVQTEIDRFYVRDQAIGILDFPHQTCWKNIVRLSSASSLVFDGSNIVIEQYWKPKYKRNYKYKTEEQSALALRAILERVISDHTRVISNVGVPLSGGLDSSTIACLAAKKMNLGHNALISASSILNPQFPNPDTEDEIEYIKAVLEQEKKIEATFIYNTDLEFLSNLEEKFNRHYSTFNQSYYVDEALYKQFKLKSVRRVLSGFLGDMTTSNSTIYPLPHLLLAGRFATFFRLSKSIKKNTQDGFLSFIKYNILIPLAPMFILKAGYRFKKHSIPWNINNLPLQFKSPEIFKLQNRKTIYYKKYWIHQLELIRNIWPTKWEAFEEDWDCGSSHHHLEMTYPLLDRRVMEFLFQIPVEHFYAGGIERGLIRMAMNGILPEKIKKRRNKHPYSPDYHKIIKRDILKVKPFLLNEKLNEQLGQIIDITKMIKQLENIVKSEISPKFVINYWEILNLSIWIAFDNWVLNKNK